MKTKRTPNLMAATLLCAGLAGNLGTLPALAAEQEVQTDIGTLDKATAGKAFPAKPPYSPCASRNVPTRPFFGDTHLHTSLSVEAGAFGKRLGSVEKRIALPVAKRSPAPAASRSNSPVRSTSSSWPITRMRWACSLWALGATPKCWPPRKAGSGMT
jgi:hypothetical protein